MVEPTGIEVTPTEARLAPGETVQLTATIAPEGSDQTTSWTSADSSIASVSDSGEVTAGKDGTAIVSVTTANGLTADATVVVEEPVVVPVESITIKPTEVIETVEGSKVQFSAEVLPAEAAQKVTWTFDTLPTAIGAKISTDGLLEITRSYVTGVTDLMTVNAISSADSRIGRKKTIYVRGPLPTPVAPSAAAITDSTDKLTFTMSLSVPPGSAGLAAKDSPGGNTSAEVTVNGETIVTGPITVGYVGVFANIGVVYRNLTIPIAPQPAGTVIQVKLLDPPLGLESPVLDIIVQEAVPLRVAQSRQMIDDDYMAMFDEHEIPYELTTTDADIATIDEAGVVEAHAPGECCVHVMVAGEEVCVVDVEVKPSLDNLDDKTVPELKTIAKQEGLSGYSGMNKSELVKVLTTQDTEG